MIYKGALAAGGNGFNLAINYSSRILCTYGYISVPNASNSMQILSFMNVAAGTNQSIASFLIERLPSLLV